MYKYNDKYTNGIVKKKFQLKVKVWQRKLDHVWNTAQPWVFNLITFVSKEDVLY